MSKSLGQFWGFESSLTDRGDRFGLLQVNVSMRIPTTSLPGISPTTPIAPSQSSSVVTITLRPDGFTVSLPHAPQHQGPIQTGVFGPRPTVANDNAQSTPTTIEVPLAAAAAMGELQVGHDLFAALGQMLRATPANTNTQGPQTQPSTATPQTHTPQAHAHQPTPSHIPANTNAQAPQQTGHTQPTSTQLTPSTTTQAPTATRTNPEVRTTLSSGLNINGPRTEGSRSLEERFLKLPQAEQRKILETLRPALERNLSAKYKNNANIPKVVSLLLNAFKEGVSPQASDTAFAQFSGIAQKAIELFQPLAQKLVQEAFQGLKKDPTASQFSADNRTEVWAAFTSTGPRQPQSAGPRTFWQAQPTAQNYPQASTSHGYQLPTTAMPYGQPQAGMNGGLPHAAQQMFGNFGNAGMTQAQAQANPLNPQFAFATQAQNSQTHGSQPYLSPNQIPYSNAEKDLGSEEFKSENARDDERGQGQQQGDQSQNQQGQQQHNGYHIVTLMGPDGRLNTLDVNGGISVVKSFFRSATIKKLHILDEIYDNQQMLNHQAGAVNTYLFRAATTQEIYNQMAPLSNGQVIQIMMTDIRNLPTSTTQLSTSKPANDNIQSAFINAA